MDSPSSLLCGEQLFGSAAVECSNTNLKTLANVANCPGPRVVSRRKARSQYVSILSSYWKQQQRCWPVHLAPRSSLQLNCAHPRVGPCHQEQQPDHVSLDAQQLCCPAMSKGFGYTQYQFFGYCEPERRAGGMNDLCQTNLSVEVSEDFLCSSGVCQDSLSLLLERAAQPYYKVSKDYVDRLVKSRAFGSDVLDKQRRESVYHICQLASIRRHNTLVAAHAVAFLDRFLSQNCYALEKNDDSEILAAACFWIAAKMDSATPNLSMFVSLGALQCDEDSIFIMEAEVLRALGWRMLSVTISDFVASILEGLKSLGLTQQRWMEVTDRADEIIQGILPEEEFLAYEPTVVSMCVIQCLLEENVPVQAAAHMASIGRTLAVDMVAASQCYKLLIDLVVDPVSKCNIPSP